MYKLIFVLSIITSLYTASHAQEKEIAINFPAGTLYIENASNLLITGYEGDEVIIVGHFHENNYPDQAKGLKKINSRSSKSEIDLKFKVSGNKLSLSELAPLGLYQIKVPRKLNINCKSGNLTYGADGNKQFEISGIAGEIEISASSTIDVFLNEVSGPISVVTHGNITARLATIPSSGSVSFDTYRGFVDVSIPANASANVNLSSNKGDIYTDLDIAKEGKGNKLASVLGTIGKGGTDLILHTEIGGNIYLRRQ